MRIHFLSIGFMSMLTLFSACKTDDVKPDPNAGAITVEISSDISSMAEDSGRIEISAVLSEVSAVPVNVSLSFSGTASYSIDYNSANSIEIPVGNLSAKIILSSIQDTIKEGNESIIVTASNVSGAVLKNTQALNLNIEDDDVPLTIQLILNEILYDPSNSGLDGDANGDGKYAQNEDEFLEIINMSTQTVDLGGYTIFDTENLALNLPNHTVPANTKLAPGKALIIFGGGTPTGTFGGASVQTSTSGDLNMNNAGDMVTIKDATGKIVLTFDIEPLSNNPNESYTRDPDLTGNFVQHSTISTKLFSPGTKSDGTDF